MQDRIYLVQILINNNIYELISLKKKIKYFPAFFLHLLEHFPIFPSLRFSIFVSNFILLSFFKHSTCCFQILANFLFCETLRLGIRFDSVFMGFSVTLIASRSSRWTSIKFRRFASPSIIFRITFAFPVRLKFLEKAKARVRYFSVRWRKTRTTRVTCY